MVAGQVSHEIKIEVPATEAWELYGTLGLADIVEQASTLIEIIEILEGDGGVGTFLKLTFVAGVFYVPNQIDQASCELCCAT